MKYFLLFIACFILSFMIIQPSISFTMFLPKPKDTLNKVLPKIELPHGNPAGSAAPVEVVQPQVQNQNCNNGQCGRYYRKGRYYYYR